MRALNDGAAVFLLAAAVSSLAATPAPSASSAAPDGYATKAKVIGKKRADAKAQENERMSKCKAMKGDEQKGCEANAKSLAKDAMKNDPAKGDVKSKP